MDTSLDLEKSLKKPAKIWQLLPPAPPEFIAEVVAHQKISPLTAQLVYNRGLKDLKQIEDFFKPSYTKLDDPFKIKGMDMAIERIKQALAKHERLAIYGDYDTDGVTACSLLVQFFRAVGADVVPRIPHRVDEGYGLNPNAIKRLADDGVTLIITVDCGVSNVAEVEYARELGVDVIITDHHRPPEILPQAVSILNVRQSDDSYDDKGLTGVGIAYHLVRALSQSGVRPLTLLKPNDLLDLVALGTIADVGPLRGENRILVRKGLEALRNSQRPGIIALIEAAGLRQSAVDGVAVGFALAPRINAAGRIDDAIIAYNLLLTEDLEEARTLAQELNRKNIERQQLLATILSEARERVLKENLTAQKIMVLSGEGWTAGVVGLVAGRLCEEFNRPVLVLEEGLEISKGSARSIPSFNVIEALTDCADLLTRYGGHKQAAGFSIKTENIPALRSRLEAIADSRLASEDLQPHLAIDTVVTLDNFVEAYNAQLALAPFGNENPAPLFVSYNLAVREARPVGVEGAHLRLRLYDPKSGIAAEGIFFREGLRALDFPSGSKIDVVYSIEPNEFMGYTTLQMRVRDMRPAANLS